MELLEHEGKSLLREWGIRIPEGALARDPGEARRAAERLGRPVVVKAQVPVGGRGKAGGIKPGDSAAEAERAARELLGSKLLGHRVGSVLVEERVAFESEAYLAATIDYACGTPVLLFAREGGVEVENILVADAAGLHRMELPAARDLEEYEGRWFLARAGLSGKALVRLADVLGRLCRGFARTDLTLCEVNPLGFLVDGNLVAVDAKVEVDDNALFRQERFGTPDDRVIDELERKARLIGVTYVRLEGDIGVVASGAGLGMNTMDLIRAAGHSPANFLETGGGITLELMRDAIALVAADARVEGVVVNLYGGINPLVEAAKGVVEGMKLLDKPKPIVVKALGNRQEEAWRVLESGGVATVKSPRTEEAVAALLARLGGGPHGHPAR